MAEDHVINSTAYLMETHRFWYCNHADIRLLRSSIQNRVSASVSRMEPEARWSGNPLKRTP
jgi:hypothetical protein